MDEKYQNYEFDPLRAPRGAEIGALPRRSMVLAEDRYAAVAATVLECGRALSCFNLLETHSVSLDLGDGMEAFMEVWQFGSKAAVWLRRGGHRTGVIVSANRRPATVQIGNGISWFALGLEQLSRRAVGKMVRSDGLPEAMAKLQHTAAAMALLARDASNYRMRLWNVQKRLDLAREHLRRLADPGAASVPSARRVSELYRSLSPAGQQEIFALLMARAESD